MSRFRWVITAKQEKIRKQTVQYLQDNRELVEEGRHLRFLVAFADNLLLQPKPLEYLMGDETLVKNALRNCLDFIEPDIPSLHELAKLRCESARNVLERVLYAACLEIYRATGCLSKVKLSLLAVLKTGLGVHYPNVANEELKKFKMEVHSLLFQDSKAAEDFLRAYIESQLGIKDCQSPQIGWLQHDDTFKHLLPSLSLEWLTRFDDLPSSVMGELFEMAAQFGERQVLEALIEERCAKFISSYLAIENDETLENQRTFWFLRAFYFLCAPPDACVQWLKSDKILVFALSERSSRMGHRGYNYWPTLSSTKIEIVLDAFINVWPRVDLPSCWGSDSPKEEKAYRFLTEEIWSIGKDDPDAAIPVLDRLLDDPRYKELHPDLRGIRASQVRKKALRDFKAPEPGKIVALLDQGEIATVEGLRALLLEEFQTYQADLNGHETTSKDIFYEDYQTKQRLGEVDATLRIADRMRLRLEHKDIIVTLEHQLKDANRCDFTCTKVFDNQRRLLVTEVKGQWHNELYSAASKQLHERYAIHPAAEQQGIYLVLWFGKDEKIAGKKKHNIESAQKLKESIEAEMPGELKGLIDVFVLDIAKD